MKRLEERLAGFKRVNTSNVVVSSIASWVKKEHDTVSSFIETEEVTCKTVMITTSFPSDNEDEVVADQDDNMLCYGYVDDESKLTDKHVEQLDYVLEKYKGYKGFVRVFPERTSWTDWETNIQHQRIRCRLLFAEVNNESKHN